MATQRIKDRVHVETEFQGANVSCVATSRGLVLIDTPYYPQEIRRWRQELAGLGEVAYVILTDFHFDHCLGSTFFSPTEIIAHELTCETMQRHDGTLRESFIPATPGLSPQLADEIMKIPLGLPTITFGSKLRLHMGDATLDLVHVGGHTDATILIHLIEDGILFTGDNVTSNRHPFKAQGNFRDWIRALETIQSLEADVIVPGHGSVCDKAEAARTLDYFRQQWERVAALRAQGCGEDEVMARCRDLVSFYPIDPGMEERVAAMFDQGIKRLFREMDRG